jgi:alpha-L-fucosidase
MRPVLLPLLFLAAHLHAEPLPKPDRGGVPPSNLYDYGVMGPPATPAIVRAALAGVTAPMAAGPVAPDWASLERHYRTPGWFDDARFGIFMHWGPYVVPAHRNEWYEKHMYDADLAWHSARFGPPATFGYKDFLPRFRAERFDADAWAALFEQAGARVVMPAAQHHDNFAMWDSKVTPFNAMAMGPRRDVVGELATAVRKRKMKFALSNHGIENFTFINPAPALDATLKAASADLYDPRWRAFYNVADRSAPAMAAFLTDWVERNIELIDRYRPDLLWFDNGVNLRVLDPLKLHVAAYYYNRAAAWNTEVSISTKYVAYAPDNDDRHQVGSIIDFEKVGTRSPPAIRSGPWMVDDTIGSTWGYTEGMTITRAPELVRRLVDTASKGGFYMLNISPQADGTIPQAQQDALRAIGAWLRTNGVAIFGTRPWSSCCDAGWRFTRRGATLYAIGQPARDGAPIAALPADAGRVKAVRQLGATGPVAFIQDATGLQLRGVQPAADGMPVVFELAMH